MDCFAESVVGPRVRADPLARNDDSTSSHPRSKACGYEFGLDASRRPGMTSGECLPQNKNSGIAAGALHFVKIALNEASDQNSMPPKPSGRRRAAVQYVAMGKQPTVRFSARLSDSSDLLR